MLLEFGAKNFFSFKEGFRVSFRLGSNCPPNISAGRDYATVMGVKGANGSGKTHVLRALSFLGHFCTRSFASDPDAALLVFPFFKSTEATELFADFCVNGIEYKYELIVDRESVLSEVLYRIKSRSVKIFERKGNTLAHCMKDFSEIETVKLRKNASIISTAHQYELKSLSGIYSFFENILTNVSFAGYRENAMSITAVAKFLNGKKDIFEFVKKFILDCDVGIEDIVITSTEKEDGSKDYFPGFFHRVEDRLHAVTDITESSGTKALFRQLAMYKMTLDLGGVLALDEFDAFLHPHILPKLLELFVDEVTNPRGAQVIFSTHQSDILDILGRQRTYLVNKQENESFCYRLDEIPGDILRNDRPIRSIYDAGKIGGVPRL